MGKGISLITNLLSYINYGKANDVNYDIARIVLRNYHDIPKMSINDLADCCFVSASSITRFIKELGFDSFKEFKKQIIDTVNINADYSKDLSFAKKDDLQPILETYTNRIKENIDFTFRNIDYSQIERICELIYNSEEVVILGLEFATMLGLHFQKKMASINKFVRIGVTEEKQQEIVETIQEGTVVLILSIEGSYFYRNNKLIVKLEEKNCKLIAVTMNGTGKLVNRCEEVLMCNKYNSDTEGRITLLYMIEVLIMCYCINYQIFTK